MKVLSMREAEASSDIDIKLVAVRASKYRLFGSTARIPESELAVADLRGGGETDEFKRQFQVLERHPVAAVMLVRRLAAQQ